MIGKNIAHYKILEKIGEGGMGVVYRARDTRLEREVALKFLPPDFSGPEEFKQRFIQEAQSASALDHPNICTIHAIEETDEGQLFIVMGYYAGQTIKAKLRNGPLPWQDVTDLAMQIAAGLGAAHERGIIHMDVKPANLLVTPEGTVKILDFGLSRFMSEMDRTRPEGPLMGTVAYMSPEQVQCETTGPESDIWALGVVLYELVTGERPFQGKNDMAVLYSIVHKDADAPFDKVPDLPVELDKIIRRTLVRDRRYRYGNIQELVTDLEPLQQSSHAVTDSLPWISQQDWKRQRLQQRVTGLLAVLAVVLLITLWARSDKSPSEASGAIFLGFENLTPGDESGWRDVALDELLTIELPEGTSLRWIREGDTGADGSPGPNWEDLSQAFREGQSLADTDLIDLRQNQDVAWILRGGYEIVEEENTQLLRMHLWVQSTRGGSTAEKVAFFGEQPVQVIAGLAQELASRFQLTPRLEASSLGLPVRGEAREALSQAMQKLRLFEVQKARDLLSRANDLQPGNAFIQIQLASAEGQLGHEDIARGLAANAVEAARRLSSEQQLYVRALKLDVEHQSSKAASMLRLVHSSIETSESEITEIDRFDLTIRLAALLRSGDDGLALKLLSPLGVENPDHPLIVLTEGIATESNARAQEIFARAAQLAVKDEALLLQARALQQEGQAWQRIGDVTTALDRLRSALEIFSAEGHIHEQAQTAVVFGVLYADEEDFVKAKKWYEKAAQFHGSTGGYFWEIRALNNLAIILVEEGNFGAAIGFYDDVVNRFQEIGAHAEQGAALCNLAVALTQNGQLDQAEEAFEGSLALLEPSGNKVFVASARSSYGKLLIKQGRLDAARDKLNEALPVHQKVEDAVDSADTITSLGQVHHYRGNLLEALANYAEAKSILEGDSKNDSGANRGEVLTLIGQIRLSQARFGEARQDLQDALDILNTLTDPHPASRTRLAYAVLLIEEGKPRQAEELAREVLKELGQSQVVLDKALAHIVLARSFLAQKSLESAQKEIDKARDLAGEIKSPLFTLPLELTQARIWTARGETNEAYLSLQDLLGIANIEKFGELQLEINFALAEVSIEDGIRVGRIQMDTVAKEASSKGFELIAKRASKIATATAVDP